MSDVCLADVLLAFGVCSVVVLHLKEFQWFVSDATINDLMNLLESLESSESDYYRSLAERCRKNIADGKLIILDDPFWTTPYPYTSEFFLRQGVWTDKLSNSTMLVFKGDLNYRKVSVNILRSA